MERGRHATAALEPRHLVALLRKAELLEHLGKTRAAATVYQNALQTITPNTRLPNVLREPMSRALEAVRKNDAALAAHLANASRAVRAEFGDADLDRADHALAALVGTRRIYHPQPTFLHVPKLPALEFYPRADFPWLAEVEAATEDSRPV